MELLRGGVLQTGAEVDAVGEVHQCPEINCGGRAERGVGTPKTPPFGTPSTSPSAAIGKRVLREPLTDRGVILGLGHHHARRGGHGRCRRGEKEEEERKESREDGEQTERERRAVWRCHLAASPGSIPLPVVANGMPGTGGPPATSATSPLPSSPLPSAKRDTVSSQRTRIPLLRCHPGLHYLQTLHPPAGPHHRRAAHSSAGATCCPHGRPPCPRGRSSRPGPRQPGTPGGSRPSQQGHIARLPPLLARPHSCVLRSRRVTEGGCVCVQGGG